MMEAVGFALTGATADERQVLLEIRAGPALTAGRARQILIGGQHPLELII